MILTALMILALTACGVSSGGKDSKNENAGRSTIEIGGEKLDSVITETAKYVSDAVKEPSINDIGGDWAVIALKKSGVRTDAIDENYYETYYDNVRAKVKSARGVLSKDQYTIYARVSLALLAIGKDPSDVEGYDLIRRLDDYKILHRQGVIAEAFALIASDAADRQLKNEDRYVADLLDAQGKDGGLSFDGTKSDVDTTAMCLPALQSRASNDERCKRAVKEALSYLSGQQKKDGGYGSAESTAQVIIGVAAAGKDPLRAKEFAKEDKNLGDGLMEYRVNNGGFCHLKGGKADEMATEQSLCALDAVRLAQDGKSFYGG